jgi:hypothetical protein
MLENKSGTMFYICFQTFCILRTETKVIVNTYMMLIYNIVNNNIEE